MKKRLFVLTSVGISLLVSSCTYDKDPFLDFKNEAKQKYVEYYQKNPGAKKAPLFYFDISTLRSALVRNENEVSFLGQMKLTDLTFSESKNYFCDIGNLPISVTDTNSDGMPDSFKVGDFVGTDAQGAPSFDVSKFVNNLPVVLHETLADGTIATYSTLTKEGTILDSSNADAYNPDFFYISDLKLSVKGLEGFTSDLLDFTGKDVCILRKDLYQAIGDLTATAIPEQFQNVFNISDMFNGFYRRAKGLKNNNEMPTSVTIQGTHLTSSDPKSAREVVVGPFSLINKILGQVINTGTTAEQTFSTSLIHDVSTIYIEDGVKTISLYAFDGSRTSDTEPSSSKIRKVYLPSTLQNVQFNAFSNLDLDELYINKTFTKDVNGNAIEKPFAYVDFGDVNISMGEGASKIELGVTGSFGHTNIKNLYFEDFANKNIETFPYSSTINLSTHKGIQENVKIFAKDGEEYKDKFNDLKTGFERYETINPFYQIVLTQDQNKKYSLTSGIASLGAGKTLYLPSKLYSLSQQESRNIVTGTTSREARPDEALFTLKLDQDLVIKSGATLIIGSEIGATKDKSGVNTGEFSSLDLNGHTLTIEDGGTVIADGFIFDSKATNKGKVIAKPNSKLTTNITIDSYRGLNKVMIDAENSVSPIDNYSLNSLLVDVEVDAGATIEANLDYIDEGFSNSSTFILISSLNTALFQLTSGKLVVNQSKISSISVSDVTLNNVDLITIRDNTSSETVDEVFGSKDFPFAISNATFKVELDTVRNNTNLLIKENDSFVANKLILNEGSSLIGKLNNKLTIANEILVDEKAQHVTFSGSYSLNDKAYESVKNLVTKYDGKLNTSYSLIEFDETNTEIPYKATRYNFEAFVGQSNKTFTKKLLKNTTGYYYSYTNSGETGSLNNNENQVLASYNNGQNTWFRGNENTAIASTELIQSYTHADKLYILKPNANKLVSWSETVASPLNNGTYLVDGKSFIKPFKSENLIEGTFLTNTPSKETIFKATQTGKEYVYTETPLTQGSKTWIEIRGFDSYRTLQIVDSQELPLKRYIAFINNTYDLGYDYDDVKHIVSKEVNGFTKTYAYTNEMKFEEFNFNALKWADKQINDVNDKLIYLNENSSWAKVDELHKGLCKFKMSDGSFYYYFLINDKWYQSVEGSIAKKYNALADMSFGVLKNKITFNGSKYKFVMRNGDANDTPFELFLPTEMIKVTKEEFPDLWPSSSPTDHLYAYRHIVKNDGSKYIFFKDDATGKVRLTKFEFAPGFTPCKPDIMNNNILTKFNFIIYKVILEGETTPRTLYILTDGTDSDNAVYAGNTNIGPNGELTDEYLAIAIFTTKDPISGLIGGNLPIK